MTLADPITIVRNRSRELVELLSDVEKIRAERRKAKSNKNKYTGVGNDGFSGTMNFEGRGGSRYGGFGSESLGGGGGGSSSYGNSSPYGNGMSSVIYFFIFLRLLTCRRLWRQRQSR